MQSLEKIQEYKKKIDELKTRKIRIETQMESIKKIYTDAKGELVSLGFGSKEKLLNEIESYKSKIESLSTNIEKLLKDGNTII